MLTDYVAYLHTLVDLSGSRPLKIVVDAGNGMGGHTVPAMFERPADRRSSPCTSSWTAASRTTRPTRSTRRTSSTCRPRSARSARTPGVAFDGDADRCFVVDERGEPVSPSAVTALVAVRELKKDPGGTIIHNLITSKAVPEIVAEHGGKPVRTRVGHSFIKAEMATTGAIFGGEHSAHYYFRDFWRADTGMLAALHVLAALGEQDGPLSELTASTAATPRPARSTRRSTTRPAGWPRSRRRSRAATG